MSFDLDTTELANEVLAAATADELEPVMAKLVKSQALVLARGVRNHSLFMPQLDRSVAHIAKVLGMRDRPTPKSNDNVVVLATQIYAIGGHTKVMGDISRLVGADKVTVILTDIYRNTPTRSVLKSDLPALGFHCRAFLLLKSGNAVDRTVELYGILAAIRPTRILLLSHHMDVCAVAGAWPFRDITDFLHHADSLPCLGASLPWSSHADLTFNCHISCRKAGLPAEYVSMALPKPPAIERPPNRGAGLLFATCGHPGKYQHPARHRWTDWAVACLREPDASIVHIGPADDAFRAEVHGALAGAEIDPGRYDFVGTKPNLTAELLSRGVDIYLGSYPEGGGRANLEAMAVRIPVIHTTMPDPEPLMYFANPLPSWVRVTDPGEMPAAIAACRRLQLEMAEPSYAAQLEEELGRFEAFLAGNPVPTIDPKSVFGATLYATSSS